MVPVQDWQEWYGKKYIVAVCIGAIIRSKTGRYIIYFMIPREACTKYEGMIELLCFICTQKDTCTEYGDMIEVICFIVAHERSANVS